MKLNETPESFLRHPISQNFQVKKIAGIENLDLAKENIMKYFLLVGTVRRFDEFLVLLAKKLGMPLEMFTYGKKNVDTSGQDLDIPTSFLERLHERNQLDQQLYDWIDSGLFSEYLASYPGDFASDLQEFRSRQLSASNAGNKSLIDSIYRNGYLNPASGLIRLAHGLPYRGMYATE